MKLQLFRIFSVLGLGLWAAAAFAQGGGATAGTINGRVTDASGGVLPGVTVTAKSPSLMGAQTSVTDAAGNYRFPALPPGTYTLTYELQGFRTAERPSVRIAIDFTATVNVELSVAALQESVTVKGESPVIDTSSTRVQQTFALETLQQIPNARDMWSLLAVTPSVTMTRTDVGGSQVGSRATTVRTGSRARRRSSSRASTSPTTPVCRSCTRTTVRSKKCRWARLARAPKSPGPESRRRC